MKILESQVSHQLSVILESPDERQRFWSAFQTMNPIAIPELHDGKTFVVLEMDGCYWDGAPEWLFCLFLRQFDTTRHDREEVRT